MIDLKDIIRQKAMNQRDESRAAMEAYWQQVRDGERPPPEQYVADYTCAACKDQGQVKYDVPVEHPDFGKLHPCPNDCTAVRGIRASRAMKQLELLRKKAGDPDNKEGLYRHYPGQPGMRLTLSGIQALYSDSQSQRLAYDMASDFVDTAPDVQINANGINRHSLLLHGAKGYGKTLLASAIINSLEDRGVAVWGGRLLTIAKRVYDVFQKTKRADSSYGSYPEFTDSDIRKAFCHFPILIIDELELNNVTNARMELVEELINTRYTEGLPTLITTNLDTEGLRRMWGGRVADRLQDAYWFCEVGGVKLRDTDSQIRME